MRLCVISNVLMCATNNPYFFRLQVEALAVLWSLRPKFLRLVEPCQETQQLWPCLDFRVQRCNENNRGVLERV